MRHSPVPELLLYPPPPLSWGLEIWNGRFKMWDRTHDTGYRFTNTTCLERIPSMVKNKGGHNTMATWDIQYTLEEKSHKLCKCRSSPQLGNFQVWLAVGTDRCVAFPVYPFAHAFFARWACYKHLWLLPNTSHPLPSWIRHQSHCYWSTLHRLRIFTIQNNFENPWTPPSHKEKWSSEPSRISCVSTC